MRYFTKEWYNDTLLAEMCFQIKKTSRASKFSESFFQYLYKAQKKWFINNQKHVARFSKVKFDLAAAEAAYDANYNENLEFVKANIPQEILEKVADVRVLAMGSASPEITDEITRFCGKINRKCEKVSEDYDEQVEMLAERIGWYKVNSLNKLANAQIVETKEEDGAFIIRTSPEYTDIACEAVLKNAAVAEADERLVGAVVLHFEILPADKEGFVELNLLCRAEDDKSVLFSAVAEDVDCEEI